MPGTCASRVEQLAREPPVRLEVRGRRPGRRSAPAGRSSGSGVTMSAGMKENCDAGKRSRQRSAQIVDVLRRSAGGPAASETRMSASRGPIGAELLYDRLMPLYGRPMLSMMLASSSRRDDLADRVLDVVAERRRLLDARAGRRAQVQLELAAVDGREEVLADPAARAASDDARRRRGTARRTAAGCATQRSSSAAIAVAQAVEAAVERRAAARTNGFAAGVGAVRVAARAPSAGTSPSSARACATGRTTRASRTRPLRPAARTGSARRR